MFEKELKKAALTMTFKEWSKKYVLKLRAGRFNPVTLYSKAWQEKRAAGSQDPIKKAAPKKKRTTKKKASTPKK